MVDGYPRIESGITTAAGHFKGKTSPFLAKVPKDLTLTVLYYLNYLEQSTLKKIRKIGRAKCRLEDMILELKIIFELVFFIAQQSTQNAISHHLFCVKP